MVAGQAGLGKTTLLATLFDSYLQPPIADLSEGSQAVIFKKTKEITDYNFGTGSCGWLAHAQSSKQSQGHGSL